MGVLLAAGPRRQVLQPQRRAQAYCLGERVDPTLALSLVSIRHYEEMGALLAAGPRYCRCHRLSTTPPSTGF